MEDINFKELVINDSKSYLDWRDYEDGDSNDYVYTHYANKMKECNVGDGEINHSKADDLLCELLENLGFNEMVEEFYKLEKWYS